MAANEPIGVAILGCGRMGERHAESVARSDAFRLVAVADRDPTAAQALAQRTGVPARADLEALCGERAAALLVVATPTPSHADAVSAALAAGKHVLCEKPLAPRAADVAALCAHAERAGRLLAVGYTYRHAPAFQRVRGLLGEGILGPPHLAILRAGGRGGHRAWKHARAGGGAVLEMMSHTVDLAVWLFGTPRSATLLTQATLLPERCIAGAVAQVDAEDYAVAELGWAGLRCLIEADLVSPGFAQQADVQAANGSVVASVVDDHPGRLFLEQARGPWRAGWSVIDAPVASPRDELWRALAADLRAGAFEPWRDQTRTVAAVLDRLRGTA